MAYFWRWLTVMMTGLFRPRMSMHVALMVIVLGAGAWVHYQSFAEENIRLLLYALGSLCLVSCIYNLARDSVMMSLEGGFLRKVIPFKRQPRIIDRLYFQNDYAKSGRPYQEVRRHFSSSDECVSMFKVSQAPRLKKICVLGTASGEILEDFHRSFGVRPWGCEISYWAYQQIPMNLRGRIRHLDMQDYVAIMRAKGQVFDLVFSCSLMYLEESDVVPFLKELSQLTVYLHYEGSYLGRACPDPYRKTLKSEVWWQRQFEAAGFEECINMWGGKSFLWRSVNFKVK